MRANFIFLFIISFFLFQNFLIAEEAQIEILKIRAEIEDGKKKVLSLNKIAEYYLYNNPDSAFSYLQYAVSSSSDLDDEELNAEINCNLAKYYILTNNPEDAVSYLNKANEYFTSQDKNTSKLKINTLYGDYFFISSNYKKAEEFYNIALKEAQRNEDQTNIDKINIKIADCKVRSGNHGSAVILYLSIVESLKKKNDNKTLRNVYIKIADLKYKEQQFHDAGEFYFKALNVNSNQFDISDNGNLLFKLAKINMKEGDFKQAEKRASDALLLAKQNNTIWLICESYSLLSEIYSAQNKKNEAIASIDSAISYSQEKIKQMSFTLKKANLFYKMKDYKAADTIAISVLNSYKNNTNDIIMNTHLFLSKNRNKLGRYAEANENLREYYQTKEMLSIMDRALRDSSLFYSVRSEFEFTMDKMKTEMQEDYDNLFRISVVLFIVVVFLLTYAIYLFVINRKMESKYRKIVQESIINIRKKRKDI